MFAPGQTLRTPRLVLRLVTEEDCTARYLGWLTDPQVNRYLETRWSEQSIGSIREFVRAMLASEHSYLFAILERGGVDHIGNIKLGPIHPHHRYADVSYFIGERSRWGMGYATEAIQAVTWFGFTVLGLHRLQAGLYQENTGSARALEKAGYQFEGRLRGQLRTPDGWEDHLWYGALCDEWVAPFPMDIAG